MVTRKSATKTAALSKAGKKPVPKSAPVHKTAQPRTAQPGTDQPRPAQAASGAPMFKPMHTELPSIAPEALQALQTRYFSQLQELIAKDAAGMASPKQPSAGGSDKRFSNPLWETMPLLHMTKGLYEANAAFMMGVADALQTDPLAKARLKFATQQWIDAVSPSNSLLTNPDAQQKLLETQGESLKQGMENFLGDLAKGHISQTDESAFEVGKNLAVTPGAVVFENELIQVIQYKPTTARVGKRPILMVPPCINKFYILDLQPENSVVAYAVSQGHTVFMLSWRNTGPSQGTLTWDDYLEQGPISAIRVAQAISGEKLINTLGFCVGGTILSTALAVLAAKGEHPAASMTLLTTLLDFASPGVLGIFIDESQVQQREQTLGKGGILEGKELASTFSALRPNDLIWNYVVSNYMMGQKPSAFDLLYWNADSTNLPGPMYAWYLRHMYLQNDLIKPGQLTCLGESVDLSAITCPVFVYGSKEDHIVPWEGSYASTHLFPGQVTFVLGASGHIAGVINPAAKNKRSHWLSPKPYGQGAGKPFPDTIQDWFDGAQEKPGSWWPVWANWLEAQKGGERPAASELGNRNFEEIEPAPGRYVKVRAEQAK